MVAVFHFILCNMLVSHFTCNSLNKGFVLLQAAIRFKPALDISWSFTYLTSNNVRNNSPEQPRVRLLGCFIPALISTSVHINNLGLSS
jgi:hypothetical protein